MFFICVVSRVLLSIGAVWPLTLMRELLVICSVYRRTSGNNRFTYSSLCIGISVNILGNILSPAWKLPEGRTLR
ncbi:uncharacterized protein EDB93DRAFT_1184736 [Suillus bovinus]|uniref:uncharacterized protein n=1 Tax=Suillus bovinus TaxID=48563 RepID=UPI001B87672F|nr:uncharacterized protein EDB93DRAFT_1184736 [Suillus bovinus]KAG2128333.1 hypothetical protein EDB93DRAFT_1184736 [Suillus bovinus]